MRIVGPSECRSDVPKGGPAGDEPLFDFDAIVGQFYISIWF